MKYQAEFYKRGEAKPFETLTGYQRFDVGTDPLESHTPYSRLDISFEYSTTSPKAELEKINTKMNDPKITPAERNALMTRMMDVQRKMVEAMTKGLQTDPASLNKEQDDFGCGLLQLYPSKSGSGDGTFVCGEKLQRRRARGDRQDDPDALTDVPQFDQPRRKSRSQPRSACRTCVACRSA